MDTPEAVPMSEQARVAAGRGKPVVIELVEPIQIGKGEPITELTITPSAKGFRGFVLPITGDGGILFNPYELAEAGVKMAGQTTLVLDKLDPADMLKIAEVVLGFLGRGLKIGSTASL